MEYQTILTVNTDGGSRGNPGKAGIGIVIKKNLNEIVAKHGEAIGVATNNVAEYRAVVKALELVSTYLKKGNKVSKINFLLDSLLVVSHLNGVWKIKDKTLLGYCIKIKEQEKKIGVPISFSHIPREQNKEADFLVNAALDNKDLLI